MRSYEDIRFEERRRPRQITIRRPEVRNAFRPNGDRMIDAFSRAREDGDVGVILHRRGRPRRSARAATSASAGTKGYVGDDGVPRLNVLDLQRQIRSLPKPVIAMVAGYAIGGGHVLHVVCDLTIAADNALQQTGPRRLVRRQLRRVVPRADGGAEEGARIWYLCEQYDAGKALAMGLVNNKVVPRSGSSRGPPVAMVGGSCSTARSRSAA